MLPTMCVLFAVCVGGLAAAVSAQASRGIPITIEEPIGYKAAGLRYHLAHFGSVPYGEVFARARVHAFDDSCMCGEVKCNTGCGNFDDTETQCQARIVEQGGLSRTEVNVFVVEEGEQDLCTRSTIAYNVARAYADAVLIIAKEGEEELVAGVDSKSAIAQSETLLLEHVNIPVGIVNFDNGTILNEAIQQADPEDIFLKLDFSWLLNKNDAGVTIQIWHTTDDDCGPACTNVAAFISDVVNMAKFLTPQDTIQVEPRFLFVNCSNADEEVCDKSCLNDDRYCYERFTNLDLYGSLIAEENIRQLCLFETLKNTASRDTRKFWLYKEHFMKNCRTQDETFNKECSEEAFDSLAETAAIKQKWQQCFENLGTDNQITSAEDEIKKMHADEVSAWLGSTVVVGGEHFRGSLDLAHVMKAACESITENLKNNTAQCQEWTSGVCVPGSEFDRDCRNPLQADEHQTQCAEMAAEPGFRCECDAGYVMVASSSGGEGQCTDLNECEEYPTLCNRDDVSRNACLNTEGSYVCEENIENECTAANNYGGCWSEEVGGVTVTSCVDEFELYKRSVQTGQRLGTVHSCDCENINGCWVGGDGDCTRMCPDGDCNPLTKECSVGADDGGNSGEAVAAALGVSMALLVAIAAAVGFLVLRRRKRAKSADDIGGASDADVGQYSNFDDESKSHIEQMSTGPIAMGGARDLYSMGSIPGGMVGAPAGASERVPPEAPPEAPAQAAAGVGARAGSGKVAAKAAAYAARTSGKQKSAFAPELVPKKGKKGVLMRNSALYVQEHPES